MYKYQDETIKEYRKLTDKTISQKSMDIGLHEYEPLIVAMDSMLRYAKAVKRGYDTRVGEDGFLGDYFKDVITGLRGLLNGNGAIAIERNISTDTKDNGAVESLFWYCMEEAGLKEEDL